MIIVSQDKNIIKFDNLIEIYKTFGDEKAVKIEAEKINDGYINLGEYVTEERANEVLEEISERLENWENLKVGQPTGVCSYRYIMPKE